MAFDVAGHTEVETIMAGIRPLRDAAACEQRVFDQGRGIPELEVKIVYKDMGLAKGRQAGMRSSSYSDANLAAQETRVGHFHQIPNDWLAERRP